MFDIMGNYRSDIPEEFFKQVDRVCKMAKIDNYVIGSTKHYMKQEIARLQKEVDELRMLCGNRDDPTELDLYANPRLLANYYKMLVKLSELNMAQRIHLHMNKTEIRANENPDVIEIPEEWAE